MNRWHPLPQKKDIAEEDAWLLGGGKKGGKKGGKAAKKGERLGWWVNLKLDPHMGGACRLLTASVAVLSAPSRQARRRRRAAPRS